MRTWTLAKALLRGLGVLIFLFLVVPGGCIPFWVTLWFVWPAAGTLIDQGFSSLVPWLTVGAIGAIMAISGYVAAARVPSHKVRAGFLLALLIGILAISGRFIGGLPDPEDLLTLMYVLICALVFPALGAFAEKKWFPRKQPLRLGRRMWSATAYAALPMGLFLPVISLLQLALYPGGEYQEGVPEQAALFGGAQPEHISRALIASGIGVLLIGYAAFTLVKTKGWKKGLTKNAYVYVTLCAMVAFGVAFVRRHSANRPDVEVQRRKAQELDKAFDLTDQMNGATLYMKAGASVSRQDLPKELLDEYRWREAESSDVTEWLQQQEDAVRLAIEASNRRTIQFPYQLKAEELGWSLADPWRLSHALGGKARLLAASGQVAEALKCVGAIHRMGTALSSQTVLHFSCGIGLRERAVRIMREILARPELDRADLELIAAKLREWAEIEAPTRQQWQQIVDWEMGWEFNELLSRARQESISTYFGTQCLRRTEMIQFQRSLLNEILESETWLGMRPRFEDVSRRGGAYAYDSLSAPFTGEITRKIRGLAMWVSGADLLNSTATHLLNDQARVRLLWSYSVVRLYELQEGALPGSWDDLVPDYLHDVPQDPWSEQPLKLRPTDSGLAIYSLGDNGEDDGGYGYFWSDEAAEFYAQDDHVTPWDTDIVLIYPLATR